MKKRIIFGITAFSRLVEHAICQDGAEPSVAYCVNRNYLPSDPDTFDLPVVAFEDLNQLYGAGNFEVLVTSGYAKMNENRRHIFAACDALHYPIASFIHSSVRSEAASIGRGNLILQDCILHYGTVLGEGNILVDGTIIGHETTLGDFNFCAGITTGGLAHIGSNCFLGMKSIISNNCTVGDFNLLGAGTVLSKDSEANQVVMPAKNRSFRADPDSMASLLV